MATFYSTADSTSNTGIDFVSFSCAFPDVTYYDKFIFYMLLPWLLIIINSALHAIIFIISNDSLKHFLF
jgi:hypothetical protein